MNVRYEISKYYGRYAVWYGDDERMALVVWGLTRFQAKKAVKRFTTFK